MVVNSNIIGRLIDRTNLLSKYGFSYFENRGIKIRALNNLASWSIETPSQTIYSNKKCAFNRGGKFFLAKPIFILLSYRQWKDRFQEIGLVVLLECNKEDDALEYNEYNLLMQYSYPNLNYLGGRRYIRCHFHLFEEDGSYNSYTGRSITDIVTETKIKINQLV